MSQVAEEKNDKGQDKILETLEALKIEVAQVKSQLKERSQETEQTSPPQGVQPQETGNQRKNTPNVHSARQLELLGVFIVIFVEVITIMQLDVDRTKAEVL